MLENLFFILIPIITTAILIALLYFFYRQGTKSVIVPLFLNVSFYLSLLFWTLVVTYLAIIKVQMSLGDYAYLLFIILSLLTSTTIGFMIFYYTVPNKHWKYPEAASLSITLILFLFDLAIIQYLFANNVYISPGLLTFIFFIIMSLLITITLVSYYHLTSSEKWKHPEAVKYSISIFSFSLLFSAAFTVEYRTYWIIILGIIFGLLGVGRLFFYAYLKPEYNKKRYDN